MRLTDGHWMAGSGRGRLCFYCSSVGSEHTFEGRAHTRINVATFPTKCLCFLVGFQRGRRGEAGEAPSPVRCACKVHTLNMAERILVIACLYLNIHISALIALQIIVATFN